MDVQGILTIFIIGLLIGAGFSREDHKKEIIKTIETRCVTGAVLQLSE